MQTTPTVTPAVTPAVALEVELSKLKSERQRRFVREYLVDGNASAAYRRAGYTCNNPRSAGNAAERLLRIPQVRRAVRLAQHERAQRLQITADMVLEGLHKEATREDEGSFHPARVSAWGLLGKHLGMFPEKRELTGKNGGPIAVAAVEPRTVEEAEAVLRAELGGDVL